MAIRTSAPDVGRSLSAMVLASEQNLLLYRTIAFGIWALAGSLYYLLRTRRPVDRETLRLPFYEQCYLVPPFALLISIGLSLMSMDRLPGCGNGPRCGCVAARWRRRRSVLPGR